MRDPNRIDEILKEIKDLWVQVPDWRLGQLLVNVSGTDHLFYFEDDKLLEQLTKWKEDTKNLQVTM